MRSVGSSVFSLLSLSALCRRTPGYYEKNTETRFLLIYIYINIILWKNHLKMSGKWLLMTSHLCLHAWMSPAYVNSLLLMSWCYFPVASSALVSVGWHPMTGYTVEGSRYGFNHSESKCVFYSIITPANLSFDRLIFFFLSMMILILAAGSLYHLCAKMRMLVVNTCCCHCAHKDTYRCYCNRLHYMHLPHILL